MSATVKWIYLYLSKEFNNREKKNYTYFLKASSALLNSPKKKINILKKKKLPNAIQQ